MFFNKKKFGLEGINRGHHKTTYRGIPCIKCPFDYVMYQMIIFEIQPDLIIEIGTNQGGSALYMADLLEKIGKGEIHSIDIEEKTGEVVKSHPRIKLFNKGWEGYDIENTLGFEKIMVIEDGSHMYESSLGAMNKFKDVVSIGSYLIVEDGILEALGISKKYFRGGPLKAIKEFLSSNQNFVMDKRWEDMFGESATFNTSGYLRRI
jgi:cephalosporin hydroxylase